MISIRSNKNGLSLGAAVLLSLSFALFAPIVLTPQSPCCSLYAQAPAKVRSISVDFVPEAGCPVEPTNIRCELDVDPFDAPMDARVYVDYKNNSDRAVAAVKFRLRFVDAQNRDRGTFHAVDNAMVAPQGQHGLKAKRDFTLHPAVVAIKARVLQVKYADGSDWASVKMRELAQPGGGAPPAAAGGMVGGDEPLQAPSAMQAPAALQPPASSTSVYGNASPGATAAGRPPVNPREYENPAPGSGAGQSFGAAQGAANPSAQAPVIDSFAPGASPAAAATYPGAAPPAAAGASGAAAAYPGVAGYAGAGTGTGAAPGAAVMPDTATAPGGVPGAINGAMPGAPVDPGMPSAPGNPPGGPPVYRPRGLQPINTPWRPDLDKPAL